MSRERADGLIGFQGEHSRFTHTPQCVGNNGVLPPVPLPVGKTNDVISRLNGKEHSPLIIRKFTAWGFPMYVGIIADHTMDELDSFVKEFIDQNRTMWDSRSIQDKRNLAGMLTEAICKKWHPVEGVAVVFYVDKMMVSSLFGDFMSHTSCRIEFYGLLNMMCHV